MHIYIYNIYQCIPIDYLGSLSAARQETPLPNPWGPESRANRRVCWSCRPEIWQATRQSCCREACPISERLEKNLKLEFGSPGTPQIPAGGNRPPSRKRPRRTSCGDVLVIVLTGALLYLSVEHQPMTKLYVAQGENWVQQDLQRHIFLFGALWHRLLMLSLYYYVRASSALILRGTHPPNESNLLWMRNERNSWDPIKLPYCTLISAMKCG